MNKNTKLGFTLIEVLVAIVIIMALASIAIPQYQRAVYKSRFHALMPVARGIFEGNENYYLGNRHYTNDLSALVITGENEYPDGTSVQLVTDDKFSYVLAKRTGVNNNYVIYQSRSAQYPSNIHCEAKKGDEMATWLCKDALGGTKVTHGSLTKGYDTYILKGSSTDGAFSSDYVDQSGLTLEEGDTCTTSINSGCRNLDASGEGTTCITLKGTQGCASSNFDDLAICTAGDLDIAGTPKAGCQFATFTNGATCIVYENSGTSAGDTACGGNSSGGRVDTTPDGKNSAKYNNAQCINESGSSFGCGRSWYSNGSTCTSSTKGGCGNSVFDNSHCIARGNNSCDKSTFKNGSICEARVSGTCPKTVETTYDTTSYCVGENNNTSFSYCPSGLPAEAGPDATRKKWGSCSNEQKAAARAAGFSTSGLTCAG